MSLYKKQKILCISPQNYEQECISENRAQRGIYFCRYCGRVLEKQLENDAKDVESFGGKNERKNVTVIGMNQDTTKIMQRNKTADEETKYFEQQFQKYFPLLGLGQTQVEYAIKKYNEFRRIREEERIKLEEEQAKIEEEMGMKQNQMENKKITNKQKRINKPTIVQGIIYLIINEQDLGKMPRDIASALGCSVKDLNKSKKRISNVLKSKGMVDISSQIYNCCDKLQIGNYTTKCQALSDEVEKYLEGREPKTIISSIICFVCDYYHKLDSSMETEIASICGVSVQNMKKVYKNLLEKKSYFENILNKISN